MSIHILIVEDQKSHAEMLGEVITRATPVFRVRYASCGAEARAALSDGPVDCVLMDYDLPDESGFECAAALRAENPDLPMIIVTGKGDETLVVEAWKRQRATD
jgi:DNA-binding NtrC family response regulator